MKKIISVILLSLAVYTISAQSPEKFNYQAIARDVNGNFLTNSSINIKIAIYADSPTGPLVWESYFDTITNGFGLFTLEIGDNGTSSYYFEDIDWPNHVHFLNVQVDYGTGYYDMGTTQLLSVPYALHAKTATNVDDADADPNNELLHSAVLGGSYLEITDAGGTKMVDLSPIQGGSATDDQTLSITDHTLTIENGNSVILPDEVDDADADPVNEIQDLLLNGNILTITLNGTPTQIDLSPYLDNTDAQDLNLSGNSLSLTGDASSVDLSIYLDNTDSQGLVLSGDLLSIENGVGSVNLANYRNDSDSDPANELISSFVLSGSNLEITDAGGTKSVNIGGSTDDQNLSLSANLLSIEDGNSVSLASYLDNTDQQSISLSGNTFSISGNVSTVDLSKYEPKWATVAGGISYSAGNVGIGTTGPTQKLDVIGNIKATSFIGDGSQLTNISSTIPSLSEVLNAGNTAGSNHIDMSGSDISNIDDIFTSTSGGSVIRLNAASALQFFNSNGSKVADIFGTTENHYELDIDLESHMIWWTDNLSKNLMALYPTGDLVVNRNIISTYGTKNFIEPHPNDSSKVIVYACIEGGEAGTYYRGESRLLNGAVTIKLPEHFSMVTSDLNLTANITPAGNCNGLYVEKISTEELIVKELSNGRSNSKFYFIINGVRKKFDDFQVIRDKNPLHY